MGAVSLAGVLSVFQQMDALLHLHQITPIMTAISIVVAQPVRILRTLFWRHLIAKKSSQVID